MVTSVNTHMVTTNSELTQARQIGGKWDKMVKKWAINKCQHLWAWKACKQWISNNSLGWLCRTKWLQDFPDKACTTWTQVWICRWCLMHKEVEMILRINNLVECYQIISFKCRIWWECNCSNNNNSKHSTICNQLYLTLRALKNWQMGLSNKWITHLQSTFWTSQSTPASKFKKFVNCLILETMTKPIWYWTSLRNKERFSTKFKRTKSKIKLKMLNSSLFNQSEHNFAKKLN